MYEGTPLKDADDAVVRARHKVEYAWMIRKNFADNFVTAIIEAELESERADADVTTYEQLEAEFVATTLIADLVAAHKEWRVALAEQIEANDAMDRVRKDWASGRVS